MTRSTPRAASLALLAALALAACDDEDAATGPFRSPTGAVPATEQRPGDPEKGYAALVNAPYVGCGIPRDAYERIASATAPEDLLPGREARNADLPYALTAHVNDDGVEIVSSNCLTCHAARFNGELIVGLGNEFADFTNDPRRTVNQAGAYVRGEAETAAWSRWADRIEGIAPYIQTKTVGVNPATNLTWALFAHRDPETLAWSKEPVIDPPPTDPLPISVPPWWGMSKKNAMFYTTIGRGDHARFMLLASMLCADSIEEAEAADAIAPDVRAFIASLEAPDWPWEIDAALAAEGEAIYAEGCARCHGTYGDEPTYPNALIALAIVDTDPEYAMAATDGRRDRFYQWVEDSYYGDVVDTAPARGYIAPPLDGIWATAPYLHNGSVPDMASLLDRDARPTYWRHRTEPREYDRETLGWRHEVLDFGQDDEPDPAQRRFIYDTTLTGYGNGGHSFSDDLSDAERRALIEYLKTL
jgi:mono/diheme cytochrome c family protein